MKHYDVRMTSEEEREQIAQLLAEMFKDVVYQNAIKRARETVKSMYEVDSPHIDDWEINYTFTINDNTIKMLLGKIRRKHETTKL
jgi:transcription initiation factor IIE alpha subunit